MTPQKLKNSILQLAIQGKLVEQRPEEGTAEELFGQIQAEKQQLIKAGTIKKEKPLPKITDDEIPFDIPESWKWTYIGELFQHNTGKALNASNKSGKPYEYITTSNLYWNRFELDKLKSMLFTEVEIERCTVIKGDLLVLEGGDIGRSAIWNYDFPMRIQNHIHRLRPYGEFCIEFFYYIFYLYKNSALINGKGIGIQGLSTNVLHKLVVPLPPLAEQKRIVAKIEELLPYIDRYEKAWSKLEDINKRFPIDMQKSILQTAIQGKLVEQRPEEGTGEELYKQIQRTILLENSAKSDSKSKDIISDISEDDLPFDIPHSWKWVRLGKIGYTNIGLTYSPKDISESGTIVLRSGNIQDNKMVYEDIVRVKMDIHENKMCCKGDIIICARNGSKRLVGKAAIVNEDGMSFGAFMAIYRSICNEYILYVINSSYFRNSLLGDTGTTTINQITQEMLKNALIPLPPLAEQKRIVAKLEEILPLCKKLI